MTELQFIQEEKDGITTLKAGIVFQNEFRVDPCYSNPTAIVYAKEQVEQAIKHGILDWLKEHASGPLDGYYKERLYQEHRGIHKEHDAQAP